jgi:formylmethanofuran dehydrogenase subunit E
MSHGTRYAPVFRQIYHDNIIPIQEFISVDFDNRQQTPVSFRYLERQYEVLELLGAYPDQVGMSTITFLVRTMNGIYALRFEPVVTAADRNNEYLPGQPARWVLHYFVEEGPAESEVEMLIELQLKQIADFHGHLCPDLVIGYRAAQYALSRLEVKLALPNLRVLVENNTSAVDAIQKLTGCTLGNLRLLIRNEGKHVYIFQVNKQRGLCLTLAPAGQVVSPIFLRLEEMIQSGKANLDETAEYQYLLDQRIVQLLHLPSESLFAASWVDVTLPEPPLSSAIQNCERCGEPVITSHLVDVQGRLLCQSCLASRRTISLDISK